MKKIIFICISVLSIILVSILIYSNATKDELKYYTIKELKSYAYEENRYMIFDIYSNKKENTIKDIDNNVYILKLDTIEVILEDVKVDVYDNNKDFLFKLSALIPNITNDEYVSDSATLEIKNSEFTLKLEIGSFSILNPKDYELLNVNSFYGSYSYINSKRILVGLNFTLSNNFNKLSKLSIGGIIKGNLVYSIPDLSCNNVIVITDILSDYNPFYINNDHVLFMESNKYFIGMTYKDLIPVRSGYLTMVLDGNKYYLDTFSYMVGELSLNEYSEYKSIGEISYA